MLVVRATYHNGFSNVPEVGCQAYFPFKAFQTTAANSVFAINITLCNTRNTTLSLSSTQLHILSLPATYTHHAKAIHSAIPRLERQCFLRAHISVFVQPISVPACSGHSGDPSTSKARAASRRCSSFACFGDCSSGPLYTFSPNSVYVWKLFGLKQGRCGTGQSMRLHSLF